MPISLLFFTPCVNGPGPFGQLCKWGPCPGPCDSAASTSSALCQAVCVKWVEGGGGECEEGVGDVETVAVFLLWGLLTFAPRQQAIPICPALPLICVAIVCSFRLVLSHAQRQTDISLWRGLLLSLCTCILA